MQTRQLGFWMCTALVIGNTIGMGIFMQPAALAPYGLNALTGWLAVVIGCGCIAIVFANLARRLPQAEGPFGYLRATLGGPVAYPALWCYWISVWATNAAIATGVAGYFTSVFPVFGSIPPALLAVAFMWFFIGINLLGARTGGRVQVLTTLLKLAPLVLVILGGAIAILAEPATYAANIPTTPLDLQSTMTASSIALFAMLGVESATVPAGRVENPERNIPRATIVGTLIVAIVYVAIVGIGMLLVPQATLAASDAPFVTIVDSLLGAGSGRWIALIVVVSGMGALNGWTLVVGELTRTLAIHHLLPTMFSRSNSRGAPAAALILTGVFATILAVMNYSAALVESFTAITLLVSAANLPMYLCCAIALLVLGWRSREGVPSLYWIVGLGGAAFSMYAFIGSGLKATAWAFALGLVVVPIYFWVRARHPEPDADAAAAPSRA